MIVAAYLSDRYYLDSAAKASIAMIVLLGLLLAGFLATTAVCTLRGQPWAWLALVIVCGVYALAAVGQLFTYVTQDTQSAAIPMAMGPILVIIFLLLKDTRDWLFRLPPALPAAQYLPGPGQVVAMVPAAYPVPVATPWPYPAPAPAPNQGAVPAPAPATGQAAATPAGDPAANPAAGDSEGQAEGQAT
jgi:hypothetical protein